METLSNFSSIYCFITFIIGAVFMLIAVCIVAMGKVKGPGNKVRFFVMINLKNSKPCLYIKDIDGKYYPIVDADNLKRFGINVFEFVDMPIEEVREIFLTLED